MLRYQFHCWRRTKVLVAHESQKKDASDHLAGGCENTITLEACGRCDVASHQIAIKTDSHGRRRTESDIYSTLKIFCTVSYRHERQIYTTEEGSRMVWIKAAVTWQKTMKWTDWKRPGDETTRTASSWHNGNWKNKNKITSFFHVLIMLLKVHMHATFFDIATVPMWRLAPPLEGGKPSDTFPICQSILKAKNRKQWLKMEFRLFLLCHFNGGMSLWHSQLLARQHGLLPVIPGWRRDFSTPWGGELKARLPRLSKLFRCEMWNQDSHSRTELNVETFHVKWSASFSILVGEHIGVVRGGARSC